MRKIFFLALFFLVSVIYFFPLQNAKAAALPTFNISAQLDGPVSGAVGQDLTYFGRATAPNVPGGISSGTILWVRADNTLDIDPATGQPYCPVNQRGTSGLNAQYCNIGGAQFGNPTTYGPTTVDFQATWHVHSSGVYYITTFVNTYTSEYYANTQGIGVARVWCSGNPFCKWTGQTSCPAAAYGANCINCGNPTDNNEYDCGPTSWKRVVIPSPTPTPTATVTPTPTGPPSPPAPIVSFDASGCTASPNTGQEVTINWDNGATVVSRVDISTDPNFGSFSSKAVSDLPNIATHTVAPSGFSGSLSFQPNTDYYVRLFYNINNTDLYSTRVKFTTKAQCTASPTPTIPTYTIEYRCADQSFDANDSGSTSPKWNPYQNPDFSGPPITLDYTFTHNVVPGGDLTLFCQFRDNKGSQSQVFSKSIKYIGGEPKITSATCTYSPTGTGTQVVIRGKNFGEHSPQGTGNVRVEGKEATITFWGQDVPEQGAPSTPGTTSPGGSPNTGGSTGSAGPTSSPTVQPTATATPLPTTITGGPVQALAAATANADIFYRVNSTISDKLGEGRHQIVLTTDDGRIVNGYCYIGLTTVSFVVKTTCLSASGNLALDNVDIDIRENVEGAKSLIKKKIKVDKDGTPVDFTPGLEIGKNYVITVRAPKTVSRKVVFTAEAGTTNLDDVILYVGDIYPVSAPDNKINAFDKAEMSREWVLNTDVTRPGDLNNDARVNSVDYSCLQNNYNKSGD